MASPSIASPVPAANIQEEIDQAAYFSTYSCGTPGSGCREISSSAGTAGFELAEQWHRFGVRAFAPAHDRPLRSRMDIGAVLAEIGQRWLFCGDNYAAYPGVVPPVTVFRPDVPQRFVMTAGAGQFRGSSSSFTFFGTGFTRPARPGEPVPVVAGAALTGGTGQFSGLFEGTLTYCGTLCPRRGFEGMVMFRVMDRNGVFADHHGETPLEPVARPDVGFTYLVFRGNAKTTDPVSPRANPDGKPGGLTVVQGLELLQTGAWVNRRGTIGSSATFGPRIGRITASIGFNPAAPGGGLANPIPFTTLNVFEFADERGHRVGSVTAESSEGRVFNTLIGGKPAIRFMGIGEIRGGDGLFAGAKGLATDNSLVVLDPHASATVYTLRLHDPDGRYARR